MKPGTKASDLIRTEPGVLVMHGMQAGWLGRSIVIQRQQFSLRGVILNGRTACIAIRAIDGSIHVTSAAHVQRAFLVKAGG